MCDKDGPQQPGAAGRAGHCGGGGRAALEEGRAVLQLLDTEQEWTVSKRREDEVESM
jgi:hypothetical protein